MKNNNDNKSEDDCNNGFINNDLFVTSVSDINKNSNSDNMLSSNYEEINNINNHLNLSN